MRGLSILELGCTHDNIIFWSVYLTFYPRFAIRSPMRCPNRIFKPSTRNTGSPFPDPAIKSVADSTHSIHVANSCLEVNITYQTPNLGLEPCVRIVSLIPFLLLEVRELSQPRGSNHHEPIDTTTSVGILTWIPQVKRNTRVFQGVRWLKPGFPQYGRAKVVFVHELDNILQAPSTPPAFNHPYMTFATMDQYPYALSRG